MNRPIQIFAIGGGGFTEMGKNGSDDMMLEDYLLAMSGPAQQVSIGYVGHAGGDDPVRLEAFNKRFECCLSTKRLGLDADAATAWEFFTSLDIVYVGGGSTIAMLKHWSETGIAKALRPAAKDGLILSGVSAGAICWFSNLLLGTVKDGFALHSGLGLLAGSACPHYGNDPIRRAAYEAEILASRLSPGLAIDDGVGIKIVDGVVVDIVCARGTAGNAYHVEPGGEEARVTPLQSGHRLA